MGDEKVCPGGVKPKTPCADGSQPKCPSGRTDTYKPKWKRCADRSKPVRQCVTGKPHCPWTKVKGWEMVGDKCCDSNGKCCACKCPCPCGSDPNRNWNLETERGVPLMATVRTATEATTAT